MSTPPEDRAATGSPNGTGETKFDELRRILLGRELDQIETVQRRLDDPQVRAKETGSVLPGAVQSANRRGLREALEPFFEKSFQNSIRRHPKEISDAIYPVMGPAIRASIAAAIREFAESLNQIIEKSASWRSIRWRMEARMTGKPFSEILLSRSLLYSVEQVFLIHRKSGILLMHVSAQSAVVKDADMVSGMLSAINDFVSDSFTGSGQELETIEVKEYKLWIQHGPKAVLVGAVRGTAPVELKGVFRSALDKIHEKLFGPLDTFKQDDLSVFEPARPYLENCLLGQKEPEARRASLGWVAAGAMLVLAAGLVFWQIRSLLRWNAFLDDLRTQPGIAVTGSERSFLGGKISGFKDPAAKDQAERLPAFHLDRNQVRFDWKPFLSLEKPFAETRAIESDVERIEQHTVRFEIGSSQLQLAEAGHLDDLAAAAMRVLKLRPGSRLAIIGHTDEVGTAEENSALSRSRAESVRNALAAQGISLASMDVNGVGNTQPVRAGASEWDRAANRSVSFRMELNARLTAP